MDGGEIPREPISQIFTRCDIYFFFDEMELNDNFLVVLKNT